MSGPALIDQEIWSGDDTPPLVWGFGDVGASQIPAGASFRLEIGWLASRFGGAGAIVVTSSDSSLVVDEDAGTVTWTYTTDQSLQIRQGTIVRYQLRCLHGGTEVWAYGPIIARGVLPLTAA